MFDSSSSSSLFQQVEGTDIIGIKLGALNSVICSFTKRAVDVIFSDTSNRTIPSVISFTKNNRQYGENAINGLYKNITSTIMSPTRWLGILHESSIKEEKKYLDNVLFKMPTPNQGYFEINNEQIEPETMIGFFLHSLQSVWERAGKITNGIVLSVPDYFNIVERMALVNSVKIANLNCLSLLNESSAITLAYGTQYYKELENSKERIVAFVDMGEAKTMIFYAAFSKESLRVIYSKSYRHLGGRNFDYLIMEYIAKDFQSKKDINLLDNIKSKTKLMDAIAKARKVLTVNSETVINIENLFQDNDLTFTLRQEEFKHITKSVSSLFRTLLADSITESQIDLLQLYSIEMVGDVLRNQIFPEAIYEEFHLTPSRTLPNDECIARGCAMYNMMISPYHSMRDFDFIQCSPYKIQMEFNVYQSKQGVFDSKKVVILEEGGNFPVRNCYKFVRSSLPNKEGFDIKLFYSNNQSGECFTQSYSISLPNYNSEFILSFEVIIDKNCFGWIDKADIIIAISSTEMTKIKCFVNPTETFPQLSHYLLLRYKTEEIQMEYKDEKYTMILNKRNEIESLIYLFKDKIKLTNDKLSQEGVNNELSKADKETIKYLDEIEQLLYSHNEKQANEFDFLREKCQTLVTMGLLEEKEVMFRKDKCELEKEIFDRINLLEKKKSELNPEQFINCSKIIDKAIKELQQFKKKFLSNEQINGEILSFKNYFIQEMNTMMQNNSK